MIQMQNGFCSEHGVVTLQKISYGPYLDAKNVFTDRTGIRVRAFSFEGWVAPAECPFFVISILVDFCGNHSPSTPCHVEFHQLTYGCSNVSVAPNTTLVIA